MGWTDRVREGWRWALSTPTGQELAQQVRERAEAGLARILGQPPHDAEPGGQAGEEGQAPQEVQAPREVEASPPEAPAGESGRRDEESPPPPG